MKYATVCSGVEAHSLAVEGMGDQAVFFSEIEKPQCGLLSAHWPNVPNFGDFTKIRLIDDGNTLTNKLKEGDKDELPAIFYHAPEISFSFKKGELDILSGGIPCTDVSIAGKREGMAEGSGTRSSLAFNYQKLIEDLEPRFVLYENVPGIFSSNGGKDFIWFISKIMNAGYVIAWRTLDAQYVTTDIHPRAVPQRRRRLWLVGYRGTDWRIPAQVLFELNKDLANEPPKRIPGKGFKTLNPDFDENDVIVPSMKKGKNLEASLFGDVDVSDNKKVAKIIPFDEMPTESDFSKVSSFEILRFVNKIGESGYIGSVFRTDRKVKKDKKVDTSPDLFSFASGEQPVQDAAEAVEEEWEGAEKITPAILENIGNAGILANGKIATFTCREWTAGIQMGPNWKEGDALPDAYDGTVCGLSDVLEDNPSPKYNLSWRACFGILKRAAGRGKELPKALEAALVTNIRENAGIVKWSALNGKATKKKETDLSERETAMLCFNEYIASVARFEDVVPVEPVKHSSESDESDGDDVDEAGDLGEDGNLPDEGNHDGRESGNAIEPDGDDASKVAKASRAVKSIDTKLDASRMEEGVSPTLLASSYKEPPAIVK